MAATQERTRLLLPKDVQPTHYTLHFTPDLVACTFTGEEEVQVIVKNPTNQLVLHALELEIKTASFETCTGHLLQSSKIQFDEKTETVTITFPETLSAGKGKFHATFSAVLNDKMMGFYRSKYTANGETRYVATTQFEPTAARRAFPCWDEPALKATFDVSLTHPENRIALSNGPLVSETPKGNGVKTSKFATTPIMSTYLLAFIVGEFDFVEGKSKEGVPLRVFTPLGRKESGLFALDVCGKVLSYFGEYYGIPYAMPKLDMVALADFAAGAMENWGLITYRETALLVDQSSGVATKQRVAYVVAHELAHQWFGNLVTMEWWKELYLNEGFATSVGNQAIAHLFPQWDIWTQFVSQYMNGALSLDALENSHPIEVEVYSSAEIEEIFDQISYSKGASVIRMISDLLGEANFRKGLNIYLNRHKFQNAVTADLWKALGEASGFDVTGFMDSYVKATGYPLISVSSVNQGKENTQFKITQRRFLASGATDPKNPKWWVNIPVMSNNMNKPSGPVQLNLKYEESQVFSIDQVKNADWVKFNYGQSGFFRVQYSPDLGAKLATAISKLELPATDRIGIESDAFALARANIIPTTEALVLVKGYQNEVDYTVLSDLAANLEKMSNVWSGESNYSDLKTFIRNLFRTSFQRLGWDKKTNEADLDTLLRSVVLGQLGNNDDPEVIEEARKKFQNFVQNKTPIEADIRFLVYSLVVGNGGENEWNTVFNQYLTAEAHEEKLRALRALGYTKHTSLLQKTLNLSLSDQVRAQDIFYVIMSTAANPLGREMTWKFFQENFAGFKKKVGDSAMIFDRTIGFIIGFFTSNEKASEIEKFFHENPTPNAERTIKQRLEAIRSSSKWLEKNRDSCAKWLAENKNF